jgi:hypothetical protein
MHSFWLPFITVDIGNLNPQLGLNFLAMP